ncbi:hypothetical protein BC835DRAFT_1411516 [Cytidiella melzeri]|nr:hypothetical protein BC835DRAFT_1411516 [Cytidiella melzeri]
MFLSTTRALRRNVVSSNLSTCKSNALPKQASLFANSSRWNTRRATSTEAKPPFIRIKVSVLFTILVGGGVVLTAYGLYDFYTSFTMWPKEVKRDLRAGIETRNTGDLNVSERFLTRALDNARNLPLEELSPEPYLKLSGIAIVLASVLEDNHKLSDAYNVYVTAFEDLRAASDRTGSEKVRAGAIAYKLGQMAELRGLPREERAWYEAACKELLGATGLPERRDLNNPVDLAELELPSWVSKLQLVEPLRALADCYNRSGDHQLALTTLLVAVPVILGSNPQDAPTENLCIGANLMNLVAETLLEGPPTPEARQQAERAVAQAVDLLELRKIRGAENVQDEPNYCELVMAAALFNWGALREMDEDLPKAKELYQRSQKQSIDVGEQSGAIQARTALRRIDRLLQKADTNKVTRVRS